MEYDTDVLIVGAGLSGLGFAVQLIRQYGNRNFEIIEKTPEIGGTWYINSYPGCGCDVPSHFFSYSFALNPNWSQKYAMQPEIDAYFKGVAAQYDILKHVRFNSEVKSARWEEQSGTWAVLIQDGKTGKLRTRRCKILISAVGALSVPKACDVPGASNFKGRLFHTARWDHSFDWAGKEVVVIGNGCSATQAVPVMSQGPKSVKRVTQFARQAHWLAERPNPEYSHLFKWAMGWIPLAMRLYRANLYWTQERDFSGFHVTNGSVLRKTWTEDAAGYIRKMAPAKYRDFLVPKSEIGCKRRVNDTDYLACLHQDNVELIYEDAIEEIIETGVRTKSGRVISADAIIVAQGFETQKPLMPMEVIGKDGLNVYEHWNQVSDGAASTYFGTCLSGFPNFFIMMGPNTLSGHLSVIYTTECQINFSLRMIRPILNYTHSRRASRSILGSSSSSANDIVEVTTEAEQRDIDEVQHKAKSLVWATGCTSWFLDPKTGRNTIMFPDFQYKFWLRSVFVSWGDFDKRSSPVAVAAAEEKRRNAILSPVWMATACTGLAVAAGAYHYRKGLDVGHLNSLLGALGIGAVKM